MKIYTKTGDKGQTSLFNGERVLKSSARVDLYGTVDELNSIIGIAISFLDTSELSKTLQKISHDLFALGADFATPLTPTPKHEPKRMGQGHVSQLETYIDQYQEELPELKNFILPGGNQAASFLHFARTVCRRAERLSIDLSQTVDLGEHSLIYLNRLSDLLFVLARFANISTGDPEIMWQKD